MSPNHDFSPVCLDVSLGQGCIPLRSRLDGAMLAHALALRATNTELSCLSANLERGAGRPCRLQATARMPGPGSAFKQPGSSSPTGVDAGFGISACQSLSAILREGSYLGLSGQSTTVLHYKSREVKPTRHAGSREARGAATVVVERGRRARRCGVYGDSSAVGDEQQRDIVETRERCTHTTRRAAQRRGRRSGVVESPRRGAGNREGTAADATHASGGETGTRQRRGCGTVERTAAVVYEPNARRRRERSGIVAVASSAAMNVSRLCGGSRHMSSARGGGRRNGVSSTAVLSRREHGVNGGVRIMSDRGAGDVANAARSAERCRDLAQATANGGRWHVSCGTVEREAASSVRANALCRPRWAPDVAHATAKARRSVAWHGGRSGSTASVSRRRWCQARCRRDARLSSVEKSRPAASRATEDSVARSSGVATTQWPRVTCRGSGGGLGEHAQRRVPTAASTAVSRCKCRVGGAQAGGDDGELDEKERGAGRRRRRQGATRTRSRRDVRGRRVQCGGQVADGVETVQCSGGSSLRESRAKVKESSGPEKHQKSRDSRYDSTKASSGSLSLFASGAIVLRCGAQGYIR
ncbi:hypothetical protein C8R45DRAFT_940614 [Mycena sanguinolenta]|nr:hypothetical protein C8R45DRAFT_940614 [Mycena sanguinolenta]